MKKRLEKGTYGYMDRLKMQEWKKSALMLVIPVLVFLIGWAVMKTRLQVVTVIAVVGCLPGCNEVVHAIMASRYHSMDKKLYEEVEAARGDRMALYENVFTTYDKNYVVDCIIISGREVLGYSSEEKTDAKAAETHLTTILKQNSYKQNVKIMKNREAYLTRVKELASGEPEEVPFREDERCPGMTRDEVVSYILQSISL